MDLRYSLSTRDVDEQQEYGESDHDKFAPSDHASLLKNVKDLEECILRDETLSW